MRTVIVLFAFPALLTSAALAQSPPATRPSDSQAIASPAVVPVKPKPGVAQPVPDANPPRINTNTPLRSTLRVKRIALMDIPGRPGFESVLFSKGFLVMAHPANESVDVYNVRLRRLVTQIKGMQGANGMAIDEAAGKLYVANTDGRQIAVIDTAKWQVERSIPLQTAPKGLLLVPSLNLLYVASWRDQAITTIDLKQGSVLSTVPVDGSPEHMAFDPQNRELYATLEAQNQVIVLDPSLKVLRRFKVVASQPTGVLLDPQSHRLFVAVRYAVLALDAATGRELGRVAAPAGVDTLHLDDGSGLLLAAAEGGDVLLIKIAGGAFRVDNEINTDVKGHAIAFDPQTQTIFLPGGREGRSKLLLLKKVDVAAAPQLEGE